MKSYGADSRAYRQLKRYWKLLLKDETTLNYTDFRRRRNYRYAYLTEQEVIDRLLTLSPELRSVYNFYQDILYAMRYKDFEQLQTAVTTSTQEPRFNICQKPGKRPKEPCVSTYQKLKTVLFTSSQTVPLKVLIIKLKPLNELPMVFETLKCFICAY